MREFGGQGLKGASTITENIIYNYLKYPQEILQKSAEINIILETFSSKLCI